MKTTLAFLMTVPLLAGCSLFGIRTTEEPPFELVREEGSIQIRQYPSTLVAQTTVTGRYDNASSIAFKRLASYIFGANVAQEDISMTAPVVQQQNTTEIAMTAPVVQESIGDAWSMSFVMPAAYSLATLPEPIDSRVVLEEVNPRTVAVLRYSGSLEEARMTAQAQILLAWLQANGYTALSGPRSAAYDPPWTIPFLRRNEIHFDVE